MFFWWSGSGVLLSSDTPGVMLAAGRFFGLLSVTGVLAQFMLMGRIKWIERSFGHDKLANVHRKVGKLVLISIIAHVLLITGSYAQISNINFLAQSVAFLQTNDLLKAQMAFGLFLVVVVSSLAIVRLKLSYETWYFVHLVTYLAVLLAFSHQLSWGGDFTNNLFTGYWYAIYFFVVANFVFYRFFVPFKNFFQYQFVVSAVTPDTKNTVSITITGRDISKFKRESGQFLIVRFLDLKRFWQAHPFSLSWGANNEDLRITVKNSGDFTSKVANISPGTKVMIDGPHGVFTNKFRTKRSVLCIAGGIGITPIRSLIEELSIKNLNVILLYSNKQADNIPLFNELKEYVSQKKLTMHLIVTEDNNYKGEHGRINSEMIKRLVPDVLGRDIYLCGPVPFMKAIEKSLSEIGISKAQLHTEKFTLH